MVFRLTGAWLFDGRFADKASGTTTQIISADATVTAARIPNSPRQPPLQSSNSPAGEVALNAPQSAEHDHVTVHGGDAVLRKPHNDSLEPTRQRRRNPKTDQCAAENERRKSLRHGEQRSTGRRKQQQHGLNAPGSIAVQQYADRQLDRRKGQEIDRGEETEIRGTERQLGTQF